MSKKRITPKIIILAGCTVLIGAILALFLGLLEEEAKAFLSDNLGENHLFVVIGVVATCILMLFFTYLLDKAGAEKEITQTDLGSRNKLLANLTELYRDRYADKMKNNLRLDFNLKLKYTTTGTSSERVEKLFMIKKEDDTGDFCQLFNNYVENIKRLLILGEPGAGKSILLLRFGLNLIEMAKMDTNFPIPIILDLATWKIEDQEFERWLELNLPYIGGSFAISKEESTRLAKSNNLLLLLDGFDEIQEQYRNSCLEKLQLYLRKLRNSRKETLPEVIICSRISEYLSVDDAPVFATVEIQPLQPEDVQAVLQSMIANNDEPAIDLQYALNENSHLYKAITSVFFLQILLDIYTQENTRPSFSAVNNVLLQKEIIETYIKNELEKMTDYPIYNVKKWLGWLAWQMRNNTRIVSFELIKLQAQWIKKKYFYLLTSVLTCVLVLIFSVNLTIQLLPHSSSYAYSFNFPKVYGFIIIGLIIGIIRSYSEIIPLEKIKFNFDNFWAKLFQSLLRGIFLGVATCLLLFLVLFLLLGFSSTSVIVGGILAFVCSVAIELFDGFSFNDAFPKISNAYQRFLAGLWTDFFRISLIITFSFGLLFFSAYNSYTSFYAGFLLGLTVGIGFSAISQHFSLRIALFFEAVIPMKLVSFLDSVAENSGLLIKNGGQWRFQHQLIFDSLANWFEENHPNKIANRNIERF